MRLPIALVVCSLLLAAAPTNAAESHTHAAAKSPSTSGAKLAQTQDALRDLWVGHIFYVREVVQALVDQDANEAQAAEQAAVQNARAIAAAIEPFYGAAARDQLFELLAGHYGAIKAHATAVVAKSDAEATKAQNDLVANANEISAFLSKANPHLPQATLQGLLMAHGGHHLQQNQQLARREYAAELRTWEEMKGHIYTIADALGGALAKQFPEKF